MKVFSLTPPSNDGKLDPILPEFHIESITKIPQGYDTQNGGLHTGCYRKGVGSTG